MLYARSDFERVGIERLGVRRMLLDVAGFFACHVSYELWAVSLELNLFTARLRPCFDRLG